MTLSGAVAAAETTAGGLRVVYPALSTAVLFLLSVQLAFAVTGFIAAGTVLQAFLCLFTARLRGAAAVPGAVARLLSSQGPIPVAPEQTARVVRFILLASEAQEVQLVGSFTQWETGHIRLQGPDATGHWKVELTLPESRHAYGQTHLLRACLAQPGVVATGESGIDYFHKQIDPAVQRKLFAALLDLAAAHAKPMVVHQNSI